MLVGGRACYGSRRRPETVDVGTGYRLPSARCRARRLRSELYLVVRRCGRRDRG